METVINYENNIFLGRTKRPEKRDLLSTYGGKPDYSPLFNKLTGENLLLRRKVPVEVVHNTDIDYLIGRRNKIEKAMLVVAVAPMIIRLFIIFS